MSDLFETAFHAHQNGNLPEAARLYRNILLGNPKHFAALYSLGFLHLQSGQFEDAQRLIGEAAKLEPRSPDAFYARGCALQNLDRSREAIDCFDKALALAPDHVEALVNRAVAFLRLEKPEEALVSLRRALRLAPEKREALVNAGNALLKLNRYAEALGVYDRAYALYPDDVIALYNRGNALLALGRDAEALEMYDRLLALRPDHGEALVNRGVVLLRLKRPSGAVETVQRALTLGVNFAEAHTTHGDVLATLGRHDEALSAYETALSLRPDFADALMGRGSVLLKRRRAEEAYAVFSRAVSVNPRSANAHNGMGNALFLLGRWADALASYAAALRANPDFAPAHAGCGSVWARQKRYDEALAAFDRALALAPDIATTWFNKGALLLVLEKYEEAHDAFDRVLVLEPAFDYAEGNRLHAKMHICDWAGLEPALVSLGAHIDGGDLVAHPFVAVISDVSLPRQLRAARAFAADTYPARPALWRGEDYGHAKILLGYVSGEFREQATAYLAAGLFEGHDRDAFAVHAIATGPNDKSAMRRRLETAFDVFTDVSAQTDEEIASFIRRSEIDILIDMNGYFGASRTGIFSWKPSPIQINYLGFPGTMGAPFMDYIVADAWVIREGGQELYSEKIACLPDTYQPNDAKRLIGERAFTRAECGLPDQGFVFCCFNNSYKITPSLFDIWMRLLARVEGSVLWLLEANSAVKANLRYEAALRGITAERIVFAPHIAAAEHLSRLRLADLFLDTLPCNAHTTASDALWVGVPVLTCSGNTFASRVAGSLLRSIGLPDLIAPSLGAYESLALRLASDPLLLAAIRTRLAENRDTTALFDTARYTRHLEAAYRTMWQRHQQGLPPAAFAVDALPK